MRSRFYDYIQTSHGKMPLLWVSHSVDLGELFVDVNIVEVISSNRRLELNDLWQDFTDGVKKYSSYRSFDRIALGNQQQPVSGLEVLDKNSNLMVLGNPGSGKTTYLQRIVTECNQGNLQPHRIPILIKLRDFVEDDDARKFEYKLEPYLAQKWQLDKTETELILNHGKALILLDGLDEVSGTDGREISKKIKQFARNYPQNQLIVTCRTNIIEDDFNWKSLRFDFVEVAYFDEQQVTAFTEHYFNAVSSNKQEGQKKAKEFLENFYLEENKNIRELAITPILLNLTCAVFNDGGKFYSKRSKLYEEGLELLLKKWDDSKGIERDEIYKVFLPEQKQELLSYLAVKKFEQPQYLLFEQEEIEGYIADFLDITRRDSRVVLEAIEKQHGLLIKQAHKVWSFSHLTFQEYFVAKWFCENKKFDDLSQYVTQSYWREVFLLSIEITRNPKPLLLNIKTVMDSLVSNNEKIQNMLSWLCDKSNSDLFFCSQSRSRCFYIDLVYNYEISQSLLLNASVISTLNLYMALKEAKNNRIDQIFILEHSLYWLIAYSRKLTPCIFFPTRFRYTMTEIGQAFKNAARACRILFVNNKISINFYEDLLNIWNQTLSFNHDSQEEFSDWWQTNGESWMIKLKETMISDLDLGHEWQFSTEDKELLEQYYHVGQLLITCLNSSSDMNSDTIAEIEKLILLPITEIEKRKHER